MTKPAAKTKNYRLTIIIIFIFLLTGSAVLALEVDYPEIGGVELNTVTQNIFPVYLKYVFNFSLAAAGMLALGVLIYAGFRYLTAGGSVSAMQEAKQRVGGALLGLLILFGSYLILTTINPQLTFFEFPELLKIQPPAPVQLSPDAPKTLYYTEIPLGGLAGELLAEKRTERLKVAVEEFQEASEKTQELAGQLDKLAEEEKELSEQMEKLVAGCTCKTTYPQFGCGYFDKECALSSPGSCGVEPCPNRGAILAKNNEIELKKETIRQKKKEICQFVYSSAGGEAGEVDSFCQKIYLPDNKTELETILKNGAPKETKGLVFWQKKLGIEIDGGKEGEEEIIGFKKLLAGLEEAEKLAKKCRSSPGGPAGRTRQLLGYSEFWQYRETLEKEKKIEKAEADNPFSYLSKDSFDAYYASALYCADDFNPNFVPAGKMDDEAFQNVTVKAPQIQEKEKTLRGTQTFCGPELLLGRVVDDTQELGKDLLAELESYMQTAKSAFSVVPDIINNANNITAVENLGKPISHIQDYQCTSGCDPWSQPYECGTEEEPRTCYTYHCKPSLSPCDGTPGSKEMPDPLSKINAELSQFTSLQGNIKNLTGTLKNYNDGAGGIAEKKAAIVGLLEQGIEEKELEISEILKELKSASQGMGVCYNPVEKQRAYSRGEKVILNRLNSCATIKQFGELKVFAFDKTGKEIKSCYGPDSTAEGSGKFDNFFCCQTETGF